MRGQSLVGGDLHQFTNLVFSKFCVVHVLLNGQQLPSTSTHVGHTLYQCFFTLPSVRVGNDCSLVSASILHQPRTFILVASPLRSPPSYFLHLAYSSAAAPLPASTACWSCSSWGVARGATRPGRARPCRAPRTRGRRERTWRWEGHRVRVSCCALRLVGEMLQV